MSTPDFTNPSVRKNFFLSQMQEGKGEFVEKQSVLVFRDEAGGEYVVPEDTIESLPVIKIRELKQFALVHCPSFPEGIVNFK